MTDPVKEMVRLAQDVADAKERSAALYAAFEAACKARDEAQTAYETADAALITARRAFMNSCSAIPPRSKT